MVLVPRTAPKVSFGVRSRDPAPQETPGPGHYDGNPPSAVFTRSGAAVFGTSPRGHRQRQGPGPGAYAVLDRRKGGPSWPWHRDHCASMSSSRRSAQSFSEDCPQDDVGPGPGAYDVAVPSLTANAPCYSMASTWTDKVYSGPGPGHYTDGGKPWKPKRGYGFGTSRREPGNPTKSPGPGQYSLGSTLGGPLPSLAARPPPASKDNGVPGPGAHDHHPDFSEDAPWAARALGSTC